MSASTLTLLGYGFLLASVLAILYANIKQKGRKRIITLLSGSLGLLIAICLFFSSLIITYIR